MKVWVEMAVPDHVAGDLVAVSGAPDWHDRMAGLWAYGDGVNARRCQVLGRRVPLVDVQVKDVRLLDGRVDERMRTGSPTYAFRIGVAGSPNIQEL